MFKKICLILSICNLINCSDSNGNGHNNHWSTEDRSYNEQRRESLPASSLIHTASSSIVSARLDRGVIDLPGIPRVTSDESPNKQTINVATTIDVTANSKCCNSNCCDDDRDNTFWCCC